MSRWRLGDVLLRQGEYGSAETMYLQALPIVERSYGVDHPMTGNLLDALAEACLDKGDFDRARSLLERALEITEASLGAEHPNVGTSLHNLATVVCVLLSLNRDHIWLIRVRRQINLSLSKLLLLLAPLMVKLMLLTHMQ